jgi:hypothetical protein
MVVAVVEVTVILQTVRVEVLAVVEEMLSLGVLQLRVMLEGTGVQALTQVLVEVVHQLLELYQIRHQLVQMVETVRQIQ